MTPWFPGEGREDNTLTCQSREEDRPSQEHNTPETIDQVALYLLLLPSGYRWKK